MIDETKLFMTKYGLDLTKQGYHAFLEEGETIQEYFSKTGNLLTNPIDGRSFIGFLDEENYPALSIIDFDQKDHIVGCTEILRKDSDVFYRSYKVGSGGILRIYHDSGLLWKADFYNKESIALVGADFDSIYSGVIFTEHKNPIDNKIFELFKKNFIVPDLEMEDTTLDRLFLQVKGHLLDKIELLNDQKKKNSFRK